MLTGGFSEQDLESIASASKVEVLEQEEVKAQDILA